jgi:hypothetical protein
MTSATDTDPRDFTLPERARWPITAEIGTSGDEETIDLTGDPARDIDAAISEEHFCQDTNTCDIARAREDGYPFCAADMLQGATETPLLDAVISRYCAHGFDFGAAADRDRSEWLESETWTQHAYRCESCNGFTFGDSCWTPEECEHCGGKVYLRTLDGYDVDGFIGGYLDAILFTESLDAVCYVDCADCGESRYDESAGELARICPHCSADNPGDISLLSHGCERNDFSADAVKELSEDCRDFIAANRADLDRYAELRGDPVTCAPDSFGRSSYSAAECAGSDFG